MSSGWRLASGLPMLWWSRTVHYMSTFINSLNYTDLDSKERATYAGFRSKPESPVFLKNLALMSDMLLKSYLTCLKVHRPTLWINLKLKDLSLTR